MNDIVCYPGNEQVQVKFDGETVWLTQGQIAELFGCDRSVATKHLQNIFECGELDEKATCANFALVQTEGQRTVTRTVTHYNLDAIISVGYRVNSKRGVQFRQWATKVLKERLLQNYVPKSAAAQSRSYGYTLPANAQETVRRVLTDNINGVLSENGVEGAESVFVWSSVAREWLHGTCISIHAVQTMARDGKLDFVLPKKERFPAWDKKLRGRGIFCVGSRLARDRIKSGLHVYETYIIGRDSNGRVGCLRFETRPPLAAVSSVPKDAPAKIPKRVTEFTARLGRARAVQGGFLRGSDV
jgi:hypothetical protein